jgi:hypothetical protein
MHVVVMHISSCQELSLQMLSAGASLRLPGSRRCHGEPPKNPYLGAILGCDLSPHQLDLELYSRWCAAEESCPLRLNLDPEHLKLIITASLHTASNTKNEKSSYDNFLLSFPSFYLFQTKPLRYLQQCTSISNS